MGEAHPTRGEEEWKSSVERVSGKVSATQILLRVENNRALSSNEEQVRGEARGGECANHQHHDSASVPSSTKIVQSSPCVSR